MSCGWLYDGEHDWGSSVSREVGEGPLFPSCIICGVSTSGGGSTHLNSAEVGVEAPPAGTLHLCFTWTDRASDWFTHVLEDAAPSQPLVTFLFLIEVVCLFGVSECCSLEIVPIWHNPCTWFPVSDPTVRSVAFFVHVLWWDWFLDFVWNVNEGNLYTLFFLASWLQLSRTLVVDWHFLLPLLNGGAAATELSNCGLT